MVAKGEFAVGVAVPSYMAFAEVLGGYDVMFVYPKNAYVTPEPMAVLKGAPHPKAAHAFIEFLLTEEGQKIFMERGLYPITSKYKVQGAPGSDAEKAVQFTAGIRSFYDIQVGNVYDPADRRREEAERGGQRLLPEGDRREAQGNHQEITSGTDATGNAPPSSGGSRCVFRKPQPCTGEFSDSPVHEGHSPIPVSSVRGRGEGMENSQGHRIKL